MYKPADTKRIIAGLLLPILLGLGLTACSKTDGGDTLTAGSAAGDSPTAVARPLTPGIEGAKLEEISGSDYRVVAEYQLPEPLFVQGAEFIDGDRLLISTGQYKRSKILIYNHSTARIETDKANKDFEFAEGATRVADKYLQMTWKDGKTYVWDQQLNPVQTLTNDREGWGLCYDRSRDLLFASDGSAELSLRAPNTFQRVSQIQVTSDGKPVTLLNELECVGDSVYANVFTQPKILRINPGNGVAQSLDFSALVDYVKSRQLYGSQADLKNSVLNGIAYRAATDTFFIFGKNWLRYFEVKIP